MEQFKRPGVGERLAHLGYLLKHTFTIVGRDRDILKPLVRMAVYAAVTVTVFFAGILAIAAGSGGWGTLLLLAAFSLFVYKFFYYNRQELAQSWLVFETGCGRDRDLPAARERVSELKGQARRLALLDMLAAWISGRKSSDRDQGIGGALVNLVLAGLGEIWDLANHFLLPAVAVDRVELSEGASRLGRLRDSIPETLVGVFGIDIMGRAAGTIMAPIYALLLLAGVGIGLWFGDSLPAALSAGQLGDLFPGEFPGWLPVGPETVFNWLPLLVCLWIGKVAGSVFERLVTSVKVIYFTLFYARILHADALAPDIREDLESYLRLEEDGAAGEPAGATSGA